MRKIRLDVETLAVDSFAMEAGESAQGSVNAYDSGPAGCSADTLCGLATCLKVTCNNSTLCRPCPTD